MDIETVANPKMVIKNLNFYYGNYLSIAEKMVTAFIGPSGCGKSTLLRTFNRMYQLYPKQKATGEILLDGANILDAKQDLNMLRAKIGMVFQKPTPFPMSIYENIAFGVKLYENLNKHDMDTRVEWALRKAALWSEVKDKLKQSGTGLSGGQQQRLCQTANTAAGRTNLRAGSNLHCPYRETDRRAEGRLHHRDRHAQHAAGRAHLRLHRLHVPRRPDRARRNQQRVHQPEAQRNRRLHYRSLRINNL